jgi:glycosyltransferase involved in cell wall biosynthesis
MKVLMTADTVGGVWTYAMDLIGALQPHGVQVLLATMGAPMNREQRVQAAALSNLEVQESHFRLEWMDDPWLDVHRAGEWLLDLEERFAPDVVHLNGYVHGQLAWNSPVLVAGHSCVVSWYHAVKNEAAPAQWATYRQEVALGLKSADWVVAPTQAMLDALNQIYRVNTRTQAIYNGRDAASFQPSHKEPFIFAAGRLWDEAKNISALEAAAQHLSWPVLVAGDNQHPNGAQYDHHHVCLLGRLEAAELARRMATASIYCLPARYEPFGLSALEAGLCGCALVLGDIPSLREVWGDAALYVGPDDHEALQSTLQCLIEDAAHRQEMGRKARERALTYTTTRMAAEYLDLYHELVESCGREVASDERLLRKKVLLP